MFLSFISCFEYSKIRPFCLSETIKKPRLRGEYSISCISYGTCSGSSPLARGILVIFQRRRMLIRIIPACAGNTRIRSSSGISAQDHPRPRGEYTASSSASDSSRGSSPPARGIPDTKSGNKSSSGIIPACAGNTRIM